MSSMKISLRSDLSLSENVVHTLKGKCEEFFLLFFDVADVNWGCIYY